MRKENDIGIIPPKDIDSSERSLSISIFFKLCLPLTILFAFIYGLFYGFLIAVALSIPLTIIIILMAEKFSNLVKIFFGGTQGRISNRKRNASVLKTAKIAKMNKDYSKAIAIVNDILLQDPEYLEAMFVKAQILHEGFNNIDSAKKLLKKIIDQAPPEETVYNWASSFYDQLLENHIV